jgi:hypothetical protein
MHRKQACVCTEQACENTTTQILMRIGTDVAILNYTSRILSIHDQKLHSISPFLLPASQGSRSTSTMALPMQNI